MALSIKNWRLLLDIIESSSDKGSEANYFISAEHDTIYFHNLYGDEFDPETEIGKTLENLGLNWDEDTSSWMTHV